MKARFLLVAACFAVYAFAPAQVLVAQSGPSTDWLSNWSPFASVADLPRSLPASGIAVPDLLSRPAPRVGLFWSVGNPAALPGERGDDWSSYRIEAGEASGDYRRPLDPGSTGSIKASVQGWSSAGDRGAAAGRFLVDNQSLGSPAFANSDRPFGSNPMVVVDTAGTSLGRTIARIEGAGGLRLGPVGLGLSLGFNAQETSTDAAPVPRRMRSATPAAVIGAVLAVPRVDRLEIGVHGRWQQTRHLTNLFTVAAPARVFHLSGYGDVRPVNISTSYRREIQRDAHAIGAGLSTHLAGTRVALFVEAGSADEEHFSAVLSVPPSDVWEAGSTTFGAAVHRNFLGDRVMLYGTARHFSLDGTVRLYDDGGQVNFAVDERLLDLSTEARVRVGEWDIGLHLSGINETRLRHDSLSARATDLRSWTTAGAAEVARGFGGGLSASAAIGLSAYNSSGSLPSLPDAGEAIQTYIAPELALYATNAVGRTGAFTLGWEPGAGRVTYLLRARFDSTEPTGSSFLSGAPRPPASWSGWKIMLGASLR